MGTPEFASGVLLNLIENKKNILAVVTVPDKPAGRGQKICQSSVKQIALKYNLPLLQPEKLKDENFIKELKSYNADVFFVIAFRMLPEVVWKIPKIGTINLHASLLPQYRGAAPINWAIINGETKTGVTSFFINNKIDCGEIILKNELIIDREDDASTLHNKLLELGKTTIIETIKVLENNNFNTTKQDLLIDNLKSAPKIFKNDCQIKFNNTCFNIYNFVRGLSPYPTAFMKIIDIENNEKIIKVFKIKYEENSNIEKIENIETDNKNFIRISCSNGWIYLEELQLMGKNKNNIKEFLLGFKNIDKYYIKN